MCDFDMLPLGAFEPRPGGGMRLHGGKGSDVAAPDPRLVEAQIKSMGVQDSAIQSILQNSADLAPLQKQQLQFGLDSAKTAYDQSQEDRGYALEKRAQYDAAMKPLLDQASSFDETARRNELYGKAAGDVTQQFGSARDQIARNMARQGVNPGDGVNASVARKIASDEALAKVVMGSRAGEVAKAEGTQLKTNAVNMLAGFPAQAAGLSGSGANFAASGLGLANSGLAGLNSGATSASTMAGKWGSNATGMFDAQANYKLAADRAANDADPFASLLGAGAKLGAAWIGMSDRRLKQDIALIGRDDRTGLNLYAFSYISDPSRRFSGVMADEVLGVMPSAVSVGGDGFYRVNYTALGLEMVELGEPA